MYFSQCSPYAHLWSSLSSELGNISKHCSNNQTGFQTCHNAFCRGCGRGGIQDIRSAEKSGRKHNCGIFGSWRAAQAQATIGNAAALPKIQDCNNSKYFPPVPPIKTQNNNNKTDTTPTSLCGPLNVKKAVCTFLECCHTCLSPHYELIHFKMNVH